MTFIETTINNFEYFVQLTEKLSGFVYRGQADSEWILSTSLEREFQKFGKGIADFKKYEKLALARFKQRYHLYAANPPDENNYFEWLALMQHHGAPTRLLDFSHSPYVAIYFASINATKECSVWAINKELLNKKNKQKVKQDSEEMRRLRNYKIPSNIEIINRGFSPNSLDITSNFVLDAEVSRPNIRIVRQQGLFIIPITLTLLNNRSSPLKAITFEDCLSSSFGKSSIVEFEKSSIGDLLEIDFHESNIACLKLNFPNEAQHLILRHLKFMGIEGESLFPGLDGLAISQIQQYIR